MKPRRIITGRRTLRVLQGGAAEVARMVGTTFGPQGGKVVVSKLGTVVPTTDGAALLREAQFGDLRRIGASLVRSASLAVEKNVGDCTTTTVLLAEAIVRIAIDASPQDRWNPVPMVAEMRDALREARDIIGNMATRANQETVLRVGLMASHEDPMVAEPLLQAILGAGENGTVVLAEGEGVGLELDQREGLTLEEGWTSHAFSDGAERTVDGPMVAVCSQPLLTVKDVQGMLESASQWPGRGLVVFAPSILGEALTTMIVNHQKKVIPSLGITFRGQRTHLSDWLEDVAAVTGSTIVGRETGHNISAWEDAWLGSARKVTARQDQTVLVSYMDGDVPARVDARVASLLHRAEDTRFDFDRDRLRKRAASLDGGVCTVKVGGVTRQEAQDRRSRAEDSLHAMQAALRDGVVPGAGMALFRASLGLPDTLGGWVLSQAMQDPLRLLAARGRQEPDVVVERVLGEIGSETDHLWMGWDPVAGTWRDFSGDVVDPVAGTIAALEAALSVASQMLLTGAVVLRT